MKQGVLQAHRVRLLLSKGHSCYRPRRTGERVRKSVRGCIVGSDISVLAVAIVKQGDADIPGLTDTVLPKRLGPKRATKVGYINHAWHKAHMRVVQRGKRYRSAGCTGQDQQGITRQAQGRFSEAMPHVRYWQEAERSAGRASTPHARAAAVIAQR